MIRCSHCFSDDFKLDDVNPNDKVKFYTDTPFKNCKPKITTAEKLPKFEDSQNIAIKFKEECND